MPIDLQGSDIPLSLEEVNRLWEVTRGKRTMADDVVVVRSVTITEIQDLNGLYRGKNKPTNVLSFSYPHDPVLSGASEHDVALCMAVAEEEARQRQEALREYVALLLVHAFLHITGMDHERSADEAAATQAVEREILEVAGFTPRHLA